MPCIQLGSNAIVCYSHVYQIYSTKAERCWWFEDGYFKCFVKKDGSEMKIQPWGGIIGQVAYWIMAHRAEFNRCADQIYLASDGWQYEITRIN